MGESKIEKLNLLKKGECIEPTPYAVWRHFPRDDLNAKSLASKQLEYLEKFDSIIMKVSPNGRYCVVDWGCEIAFDDKKASGSAICTKYRINTLDDWTGLEELDVNSGMFGEQLKALKLIKKGLRDDTPFVETIFNPLMVAGKLTEDRKMVKKALIEKPEILKEALKIISRVMTEFAKASLDYGAAGIFLATQEATSDFMTEKDFLDFGLKYDQEIFETIKNKSLFNIAHIHGEQIMFDLIAKHYPVDAINWHDQLTEPSLTEASEIFDGVLMGGIEEQSYLFKAEEEEIIAKLAEIINSVNNKKLIISPGCVIPITVPDEKVAIITNYLKKN